jgi:hypothetical protein
MDSRLPAFGRSPREIAKAGGDGYTKLLQGIGLLDRMVRDRTWGGPPEDLLGLPLEAVRDIRLREEREYRERIAEASRRSQEERVRREVEAARKSSEEAVQGLLTYAVSALGKEQSVVMMEEYIFRATGQSLAVGRSELSETDIKQVWSDVRGTCEPILERLARERAEAARTANAEIVAAECRARLSAAVEDKFRDPIASGLWLKTTHLPINARPIEYCVDETTLNRCLSLLDSISPRSRRR